MRYRNHAYIANFFILIYMICIGFHGPTPIAAAEQGDDDRERQVMERFLAVLERAPRRGTALDRVYGYHVERGTLDALIKTYQDRTAKDPHDGAAWLLVGLLEAQRGRDAAAVAALRQAEQERKEDALPAYYLGQSLVLVGQPDAAVLAWSGRSSAIPCGATCSRSSRCWGESISAPIATNRRSASGRGWRRSFPTTRGCGNRSPRSWPRSRSSSRAAPLRSPGQVEPRLLSPGAVWPRGGRPQGPPRPPAGGAARLRGAARRS